MGAQTTLLSFSKGCNSRCSQFVTFSLFDNSNIVACGRIDCFSQTFHLEGCCFEFKQIGEGPDWTSFVYFPESMLIQRTFKLCLFFHLKIFCKELMAAWDNKKERLQFVFFPL